MNKFYDGSKYCASCKLIQSIVRLRCEECKRMLRRRAVVRKYNMDKLILKRYAITLIHTAFILCSSLYNTIFILHATL